MEQVIFSISSDTLAKLDPLIRKAIDAWKEAQKEQMAFDRLALRVQAASTLADYDKGGAFGWLEELVKELAKKEAGNGSAKGSD